MNVSKIVSCGIRVIRADTVAPAPRPPRTAERSLVPQPSVHPIAPSILLQVIPAQTRSRWLVLPFGEQGRGPEGENGGSGVDPPPSSCCH